MNNEKNTRLQLLNSDWDLIIIGGGITGAGIFRMASQVGWKALLVDQSDFSYGTSSRSSKMVHGGLRYLKNLQFNVTYESIREREKLLKEASNIVTPLKFIFPLYEEYHTSPLKLGFSLFIYDSFAHKRAHGKIAQDEVYQLNPSLRKSGFIQNFYYFDALVDDARLVYRNIQEGIDYGGTALNYTKVERLLSTQAGHIYGVALRDCSTDSNTTTEVFAKVIVNATGPWTDEIRKHINVKPIIRKLRGSHLIFSSARFPISNAFSIFHPDDGRSLFIIPWEGSTLIGTTDLDHSPEYEIKSPEPFCTSQETSYLIRAANYFFPDYELSEKDLLATFSGIRPVINTGKSNPSKESRAHVILEENGLITITGGKLTTYHKMAKDVLSRISARVKKEAIQNLFNQPVLDPLEERNIKDISPEKRNKLLGRYGNTVYQFLENSNAKEMEMIPGTTYMWAEVRWAARYENIIHLDDLLLRRLRLGLLSQQGGVSYINQLKPIVMHELGWNETKWNHEVTRYKNIWNDCYYLQDLKK